MRRYEKYKDSGVEWIGEIPEHWSVKKLNYCFNLIGSGTTPTAGNQEYYENGKYNWLQTGDLSDSEIYDTSKKITKAAIKNYTTLKIYPINSLIIAMYGATIGKTGILKIESTTNQACCVLSNSNEIHYKYGFYWLNTVKPHIMSLSYGGGQPNINQEQIRSLKIQVPTPEEQTAIATYLDHKTAEIDALITDKKRLLELYEEEKLAIINEAVTKGLASTRLASTGSAAFALGGVGSKKKKVLEESAALGGVRMKDSGIEWMGEIPAHWETSRLKYIGHFINGYSFNSSDFTTSGVRVLKISNIQHMRLDWNDESFIDENFLDTHKNFRVLLNDLVFSLTRPIISTGIKVALVNSTEPILLNQRNSIFRPHKTNIKWIFYILLSSNFIQEFESKIDKTGQQPNISSNDIGEIYIPIPNEIEQAEIISYLDKKCIGIEIKKIKTQKLIDLLTEYRTALISEVVTGKVKVV